MHKHGFTIVKDMQSWLQEALEQVDEELEKRR